MIKVTVNLQTLYVLNQHKPMLVPCVLHGHGEVFIESFEQSWC